MRSLARSAYLIAPTLVATYSIRREFHRLGRSSVVSMETPEYRRDHDRLGHVVMVSAGRDPLLDPLMGASLIEVDLVLPSQRIEVSIAKQENVVEHLSPCTAHKALHHRIHLGRSDCDLDDLRPGPVRHSVKRCSTLVVAVAQEETRGMAIHGCVAQLLGRPFLRGIPRGGGVDHSSRPKMDDEECVDLAEEDVIGLHKVTRPGLVGVILQERRPGLSATARADRAHIFLHGAFADLDAQFEQFPTDALSTPQPTSAGHVANEVDGLLRQWRVSTRPRASPPKQTETGSGSA